MDNKLFWYKARVVHIVDGDTMDVEVDLGLKVLIRERIRLAGVDTPEIFGIDKESNEYAEGVAARLFVEKKLLNKVIWLNTVKDKTGQYGRYLGYIFIQNEEGAHISIGKLLLDEGLAVKWEK
jgi:micrococcal nuclease